MSQFNDPMEFAINLFLKARERVTLNPHQLTYEEKNVKPTGVIRQQLNRLSDDRVSKIFYLLLYKQAEDLTDEFIDDVVKCFPKAKIRVLVVYNYLLNVAINNKENIVYNVQSMDEYITHISNFRHIVKSPMFSEVFLWNYIDKMPADELNSIYEQV